MSVVAPAPGVGRLRVERVSGASAVTACSARDPLRLLAPRHRGQAAWVWMASFGGGLVAGDRIDLTCEIAAGASCYLGSQATTKAYRRDERGGVGQHLHARVAAGGLLALLPEHLCAFAGAAVRQTTVVDLEPGASAVILDAVSAGRSAYRLAEHWDAAAVQTRVRLALDGELILADGIDLEAVAGFPSPAARMGPITMIANLALVGPATEVMRDALRDEVRGQRPGIAYESLAPIGDGLLWRLAGTSVEAVQERVQGIVCALEPELGGRPWRYATR